MGSLGGGIPTVARRLSWGSCGGAATTVTAAAGGVELSLSRSNRGLPG